MFNAPLLPRFLITRQIECISCKEVFTIAEDHARRIKKPYTDEWRLSPDHYPDTRLRYQPDRTRRPVTPETRSSPYPSGHFSGWDGRPVRVNCPRCGTDNRNWLHLAAISASPLRQFPVLIICLVVLILVLAAAVALHFDPLAFWDELVAGVLWQNLAQGAFWREFAPGELRRSLSLVIVIFLAGFLPLLLIPPQWKRLREHIHLQKVRTTRPVIDISPPARTGLSLFIIFVFLVPFILFLVVPWTFNQGIAFLSPEGEPTLVQRIDEISRKLPAAIRNTPEEENAPLRNAITSLEALLNEGINEETLACERLQIEAMIDQMQLVTTTNSDARRAGLIADATANLEALRDSSQCRDELVASADASLQTLLDFEEEECARARRAAATTTPGTLPSVCNTIFIADIIENLPNLQDDTEPPEGDESGEDNLLEHVDNVLGRVRQLTQESVDAARVQRIETNLNALERFIEPEEQGWFTAGRDFLRNWLWLVGLVSLTSTVITLDAIDRYARGVDHHLPRPIFYSVANMTRVAIWEAKRSLEIDGDMSHVHWNRVERNGTGGIILYGLHYDIFEPGQKVDPLYQRVRAQLYMISTDSWGRIHEANIRNGRVPRPPESPDSSLTEEFFEHIPLPAQQERISAR